MSQKNVELVVSAVDAINRADVEAFVACFHPDIEGVVSGERFPGFGGTYDTFIGEIPLFSSPSWSQVALLTQGLQRAYSAVKRPNMPWR